MTEQVKQVEKPRLFCVSCRSPLIEVPLAEVGVWVMCINKKCPRVGLLSGISLSVQKKNVEDNKKSKR